MIETDQGHIIFHGYQKQAENYKHIGRVVYDTGQLAPLKKQYWPETKVNALHLGD
jgi:hypothetical protein